MYIAYNKSRYFLDRYCRRFDRSTPSKTSIGLPRCMPHRRRSYYLDLLKKHSARDHLASGIGASRVLYDDDDNGKPK